MGQPICVSPCISVGANGILKTHRAPSFLQREWSYRRRRATSSFFVQTSLFSALGYVCAYAREDRTSRNSRMRRHHSLASFLPLPSVCPPLHASHRQTATSRTSRSREISEANPTGIPLAFHKSTAPSIRMTFLHLVAHSSFRLALFPVYPLMPNLDTRTWAAKNILPYRPHHLPVARRTHSSPALFM